MAALTWSTTTGAVVSREATDFVAGTFTGTASSTEGMQLGGVKAFAVYVLADSGKVINAAGGALAYIQNPHSGIWNRAEVYDVAAGTVTGVRGVYCQGFNVISPVGRIGYVNNGFTVDSGTLTLKLVASDSAGILL